MTDFREAEDKADVLLIEYRHLLKQLEGVSGFTYGHRAFANARWRVDPMGAVGMLRDWVKSAKEGWK